ncbi:TcaA second domain-containing protein [Lentibacillus daqui]|uniref:TcaA second domain-containing protein n=1 Tax=Lentibacillus daqui TaxID=2911514 RepID=UPI0022B09150|nr:hypothetical protein [Lentibacillus daqui]
MNKRWFISGGGIIAIIAVLVIIYAGMANQHKPEKTVKAFNEAVEKNDTNTLKKLVEPDKQEAVINKTSLSAFVAYLKENNESFQVIKDELKKQIEDKDFTSSKEQVSLFEDGKTMGIFPNYKLKIRTVNLKAKGQDDSDKLSLAIKGEKRPLNKVDKKKEIFGPIFPGEYKVKATVKNALGTFDKEEKKDVWGDADVSFLIDDEKLARGNKKVEKDIINATNNFNEDMSVYVTSGFNPDKFTNSTNDFKKKLIGLDDDFKAIKGHVKNMESQFLESIINMDDLDLSLFEGDWTAEVSVLVSYNEKVKMEKEKDFIDVSYKNLRHFTLKYDKHKGKWMVDDLISEKADGTETEDWENKKTIKIDNPPVHKWSNKKDSFI